MQENTRATRVCVSQIVWIMQMESMMTVNIDKSCSFWDAISDSVYYMSIMTSI